MNERVPYANCPLCNCPTMSDTVKADCSKHPLYHSAISPVMRWK